MPLNQEQNYCDGSGPHAAGETRVLPSVGGANLILCIQCYRRELNWRAMRNFELAEDARYPLPSWDSLAVYTGE